MAARGKAANDESTAPAVTPAMSRLDWALAFERKVDELRRGMGRKYLATVINAMAKASSQ